MPHKPGVCQSCGGATSYKTNIRCKKCYTSRGVSDWSLSGRGLASDGFKVDGDRAELLATTSEPIKTLADLIRVCEIDTAEWEIVSWKANKWESAAKDEKTQRLVTRPMFQVTATMKRKVAVVSARREIEAMIAEAKKRIGPQRPVKRIVPAGDHMLEISIPDLHIGKLAWSEETYGANYDHKIAIGLYRDALEALITRTAAFRFARIVVPVGNDFFHSDTKAGTTTGGTPLDTDSRFQKTYVAGRRLMVDAVERLRQIAPVTLVMVPGNHDSLSTFCLGDSLECWYHQTPDVQVLNLPTPRKYIEFGKCMLMFTHGDKGKKDNYPLLMATEQPEMFGRTKFRECHTGHLHQLQVKELMGVRTRISPALCAPDAWHSEHHFVGNQRAAEAFVWHPEEGLVSLAVYTVPSEAAA
jgi:hypothetical protein